jgi:hypothetical protein
MLATDFITKWRSADLTERAAAQSHFRDLCDLLGEEAPTDADPKMKRDYDRRAGGQWLASISQGVLPSGRGGMRSRSAIASPAS